MRRQGLEPRTTDWNGIAKFGRGYTGSAISEVLATFPEATLTLTPAITEEYQSEADSAHLGSSY